MHRLSFGDPNPPLLSQVVSLHYLCFSYSHLMSFPSNYLSTFILFYCTYIRGFGKYPLQGQNSEESQRKKKSAIRVSEPVVCRLCGKICSDKVDLVFHLESHLGKDLSHRQRSMEQSAGTSRQEAADPDPISCYVCHEIFPDYVKLVLHCQSHFGKEIPYPVQVDENSSPAEEMVAINHPNKIPRMADNSSASELLNPPVGDSSPVRGLVLNSSPSIGSFYAQPGSSQLRGLHSTQSQKIATPSPSFPVLNSQHALCTPDLNLPPESSIEQNVGENTVNVGNEVIVISDDEEGDVEKLDLNLKL